MSTGAVAKNWNGTETYIPYFLANSASHGFNEQTIIENFFKFWLNGVDKKKILNSNRTEAIQIIEQAGLRSDCPFLFYPARYDSWKRQDMAIDILNLLKKEVTQYSSCYVVVIFIIKTTFNTWLLKLKNIICMIR